MINEFKCQHNRSDYICNTGYACDGCPFNEDVIVMKADIKLILDGGNTRIQKEEIERIIEAAAMKAREMRIKVIHSEYNR